ncbi:cache domain-containing sensor histidine kinase [Cohnella fermenti]|uniref:cache domain-containing sensor histidine kinase n=1 Tax=Cohnella fermenti TaxID=2565925 RepID=UPI001454C9EF|nr:sensor histidine kinase [Cohnella fermenti]
MYRRRSGRTLRRKLAIAAALCLLLPAVFTLIAGDYLTQRIVRAQVVDNENKSLELTDVYISSLLDNMIRVSNGIMFDTDINLALKEMWQRYRLGQSDPAQDTYDTKNIGYILSSIANTMEPVYVTILTSQGRYFTNYQFNLYGGFNPSEFLDMAWMKQIEELPAFDIGWVGLVDQYTAGSVDAEPYLLTMARNLRLASSRESYAYIIMSIEPAALGEIFKHDVGRQDTVLIDREGRILVSKDRSAIGQQFVFRDEVDKADKPLSVRYDGEEFLLSRHDLNYGGYRVVSLRPYKEAVDQIHSVSRLSFLIQIGAVAIFLVLFLYMVRQFTKPVVKLGETAISVEAGDLSVRSGVRGRDEIGRLGKLFDQMLERIERMIEEVKDEQALKRKAELAMLQAQINPHFLFNILNSIRLRILMKGDEENAELLSSLSGLLRMTIRRDEEFTALHGELEMLRRYIELLNFRQQEKVELVIDAASDTLHLKLPRFLLQPVIENAYIHGLRQERGTIEIKAMRTGEELLLTIADNGVGMSEKKLEKMRSEFRDLGGALPEEGAGRLSGIGLSNVFERLQLIYGDRFRLTLDSRQGQGTRIAIAIPIQS